MSDKQETESEKTTRIGSMQVASVMAAFIGGSVLFGAWTEREAIWKKLKKLFGRGL